MPEDLKDLFYINITSRPNCYRLKGTDYLYIDRENFRWINVVGYRYLTFEEVLDNVPKDIQSRLLFHLDYF